MDLTPKRYQLFWLSTVTGTGIILTVVILDFSTLRSTHLKILTLKRYHKYPCHFYMGVPPLGLIHACTPVAWSLICYTPLQ